MCFGPDNRRETDKGRHFLGGLFYLAPSASCPPASRIPNRVRGLRRSWIDSLNGSPGRTMPDRCSCRPYSCGSRVGVVGAARIRVERLTLRDILASLVRAILKSLVVADAAAIAVSAAAVDCAGIAITASRVATLGSRVDSGCKPGRHSSRSLRCSRSQRSRSRIRSRSLSRQRSLFRS